MISDYKIPISLLILIVVIPAVFSPGLKNGFTNWDDPLLLTENPLIRQASVKNILAVFGLAHARAIHQYHPLVFLTFMAEYRIAGPNPRIYHLTNILLHTLNCVLIFWLVLLLFKDHTLALIVSLFFAVHPLHVQSVAWITERKDLLYTLFFLAAMICHYFYRKQRGRQYRLFTLLFFLLALLSKSMAITLPFVLLLIDSHFGSIRHRRVWLEKIPHFMVAAAFALINILILQTGQLNTLDQEPLSLGGKFISLFYGLVFLLKKFFIPHPLAPRYPRFYESGEALSAGFLLFALLLFILLLIYFSRKKKDPNSQWGMWFFVITVSPTLMLMFWGFPPFDHYFYLPILGLILAIALVIRAWVNMVPEEGRGWLVAGAVVLVVILADFSYLTWQRCRVWDSSQRLWNEALTHYPTHVAFNNLGLAQVEARNFRAAALNFKRALRIRPHFETLYNLGLAHQRLGEPETAIADYTRAIELRPEYHQAYNNRGQVHAQLGNYRAAVADYTRAIELFPRHTRALINRALAHFIMGERNRALADLAAAAEADPGNDEIFYSRAMIHQAGGDSRAALGDLNTTLRLNPRHTGALFNRGVIFEIAGRPSDSIKDYEQAIQTNPRFLPSHIRLLGIYSRDKENGDWLRAWSRLHHHRPDVTTGIVRILLPI